MRTVNPLKLKEQEIRAWFRTCDPNNPEHRAALKRAAQMIFARQTAAEQAAEETHDLNGVGFSGRDANFGSRIAKWQGEITVRMAIGARSMLSHYARQLAEIKLGINR